MVSDEAAASAPEAAAAIRAGPAQQAMAAKATATSNPAVPLEAVGSRRGGVLMVVRLLGRC
ncbi:hypothetical protein [Streptomyces mirabilis]|uniref:Uncharacterized protein n=1 Tax=Streptomyces mirabilis TaxID=68239 RepID=A0ABU3UTM3_9ACTN|nr:hypothetical protein [Streptomyces mirabilis]MDU8997276.1 hypothetical protein [Streptomyces mirabilis]